MAKCERVRDDGFVRSGLVAVRETGRHGLLRSKANINGVWFERRGVSSTLRLSVDHGAAIIELGMVRSRDGMG